LAVGGFYLYVYAQWADPVMEKRVVSGLVTDWMRGQRKLRDPDHVAISVLLDDGRRIVILQRTPDILVGGPAIRG
jgi:hypothetical protein